MRVYNTLGDIWYKNLYLYRIFYWYFKIEILVWTRIWTLDFYVFVQVYNHSTTKHKRKIHQVKRSSCLYKIAKYSNACTVLFTTRYILQPRWLGFLEMKINGSKKSPWIRLTWASHIEWHPRDSGYSVHFWICVTVCPSQTGWCSIISSYIRRWIAYRLQAL